MLQNHSHIKRRTLVALLKDGQFKEAKDHADKLLKRGIPVSSINYRAYQVIKYYIEHDLRNAWNMVFHFKDNPYYWGGWMTKA